MPVRVEALLARSMHDARFRELHKTLPRNPDVRLRRTRKARTRLDPLQSSSSLLVLSGATRELLRQLIERSMRESFLVDAVERRWRSLRTGRAFHRWADPIRKARHQARMRWSSAIHKVSDMRKGDQKVVAVIAVREDGELPI